MDTGSLWPLRKKEVRSERKEVLNIEKLTAAIFSRTKDKNNLTSVFPILNALLRSQPPTVLLTLGLFCFSRGQGKQMRIFHSSN